MLRTLTVVARGLWEVLELDRNALPLNDIIRRGTGIETIQVACRTPEAAVNRIEYLVERNVLERAPARGTKRFRLAMQHPFIVHALRDAPVRTAGKENPTLQS